MAGNAEVSRRELLASLGAIAMMERTEESARAEEDASGERATPGGAQTRPYAPHRCRPCPGRLCGPVPRRGGLRRTQPAGRPARSGPGTLSLRYVCGGGEVPGVEEYPGHAPGGGPDREPA